MKTKSDIKPRTAFWLLFAAGAAIMAISGCDSQTKSGFATDEATEEVYVVTPDPLGLLAIGVPEFGDEISRQWSAQRDGELKIMHMSLEEFAESKVSTENVDLIVHPSSINVDLVSRKLIRVFSSDVMDDDDLNRWAFLEHYRKSLVRHDDKTWSVSLGGQQMRLMYRKDILKAADISVPSTWEDLGKAIEKLEEVDAAKGMKPLLVPTTGGMASQTFMARAACMIRDPGKLTSFFQRRTMEPTIASAPFVTALEDTKNYAAKTDGKLSVAEVFAKFAGGESVFAIGWPILSDEIDTEALEAESANWGVVRLPGSEQFFDLKESRWQARDRDDETQVDLLGVKATNISIADLTANQKDAAEFVIWLTEKRNSQKLLQGIGAPFRATHVAKIGQWYSMEQIDRNFWNQFADSVQETHESRIFLMFPQIPGKRQYLKLLDDAIVGYLESTDADAKETLEKVAESWDALTEKLGRESQIEQLRCGNGI
jgi:ABC-type glycerol-3-phosphate transport system substrate-binding protein